MCEKSDASFDLLMAEYDRIKSEQAQRIGFRDNMLFVYLAAVGAVGGWVLSNLTPAPPAAASPYTAYALLAIPWVGIVLGWTYVVNDHMISRTGKYVRVVMSPRAKEVAQHSLLKITIKEDGKEHEIADFFGWEPFHKADNRRKSRKVFQTIVDIATFGVPPVISIFGFIIISKWSPGLSLQVWSVSDWITGMSILIESLLLIYLLISIIAYADHSLLEPPKPTNTATVSNPTSSNTKG